MANTIVVKRSSVAGKVPTAGDLQVGELAVNLADQKIYSKNAAGTVVQLGGGSGDVVGPASATDNALVRFDGTTGKLVQNSQGLLDDSGNLDVASAKADYFDFDTTVVPADAVARVAWDDGYGTEKVGLKGGNVNLYEGQQLFVRAYNGSGTAMTKGQIVYIVGAQGNRVDVRLAQANAESTSANTIGMVAEAIAAGGEGFVQVSGSIPKLDTSTLTAGQALYLSPTTAGAYTTTKPTAPNHLVVLGWVERVSATVGSIYLKIDNGYELDELHNVNITSATSGNTLIYDATAGYWKNANISAGTGISVTNGAGSITVANTAPDQTVSLTGAGATTISGTYPNFTITSVNTTYSAATSTVAGLIELGSDTQQTVAANAVTATASRTYALQVNAAGQGVVNVPWTDTVYSLPTATTTVLGGVKLGSDTAQTTAANAVTTTASRSYALQLNASGQGVINVPWTDTVYTLPSATTTVLGGIKLGSDTAQTVAANAVSATASRTYALQVNASGQGVVNVPWTDTNSGGTVTSVGGTGTVSGLTLTGTVTTSGNLTLGGTLSVTPSNFASQTANTVLAAPNGAAGVPTFRAIVAADIPTLNQNTTGTASNVTGTVAIANGGTGATTAAAALTNLGAYAASNPSGYTSNTGTVTSVATSGAITGGTITTTGTISHLTSDGYLHVPATGTTNNGKVLTAGATAGSLSWQTPTTGTVTSVTGGSYLTGGTITTSGTLAVDATSANTASKVVARDASGNFSAGTITAALSGNATTATTLATGRTIAMTGDVSYTSGSFDGSANVTGTATLANSGVTAGSYGSSSAIPVVTVDAKGRVTNMTTATVAGGQYFGTAAVKAIAYNANSIGENITITAGNNGLSAGPITINTGFAVTVETGASWSIV